MFLVAILPIKAAIRSLIIKYKVTVKNVSDNKKYLIRWNLHFMWYFKWQYMDLLVMELIPLYKWTQYSTLRYITWIKEKMAIKATIWLLFPNRESQELPFLFFPFASWQINLESFELLWYIRKDEVHIGKKKDYNWRDSRENLCGGEISPNARTKHMMPYFLNTQKDVIWAISLHSIWLRHILKYL